MTVAGGVQAARAWPESEKDKIIRIKMEEKHRIEEEERLKQAEIARKLAEIEEEKRQ